jgi:hypothetical protein
LALKTWNGKTTQTGIMADKNGFANRPTTIAYDAFISYNHAGDRSTAEQLQRSLESFAKPLFRRRSMRVFRDDTNLEATPDLWGTVVEALGKSGFFILLASPESAQSKWVDREVSTYLDNHDRTRIGVVLTAGKLPWTDPDTQPGVPECAVSPRAFERLGIYQQEPLVIDLRPYRNAADRLNTRKPGYDNAIATLAASILRRDKDSLFGDHITRQRRMRTSVGVATIAFVALGLFGIKQFQTASTEALAKRENRARSLASYSRDPKPCPAPVEASNAALKMLLATAALQVTQRAGDPPISFARQVLLQTLARRTLGNSNGLPSFIPQSRGSWRVSPMIFSAGGRSLYGYALRNGVRRWICPGHDPMHCAGRMAGQVIGALRGAYGSVVFSPDRRWLAATNRTGTQVSVRSLLDDEPTTTLKLKFSSKVFSLSYEARRLLTASAKGMQLWHLRADPPSNIPLDPPDEARVTAAAFSHDGQWLAASTKTGMYLWDIEESTAAPARQLDKDHIDHSSIAFSAGGRWLAAGANLWDLDDEGFTHTLLPVNGQRVVVVNFSDDGRWLFLGGETYANISARLWDLHAIETEKEPLVLLDERNMGGARYNLGVLSAAFSPDGRWLATAIREKQRILLWPLAVADMITVGHKVAGRALSPEEAACYELSDLLD